MDPAVNPAFTQKIQTDYPGSGVNFRKYGLIGLVVVVFVIFWVWLNSPMVITVNGSGEVSVPATSATLSFTLSANDANPQTAISSVTSKAVSIIEILKNSGISDQDISQSQVNAVPSALVTQGGTGYQAIISMSAKTVHVTDLSSLIGLLYSNGVLVVSQPILSVDNQQVLEQQAFTDAMAEADKEAWNIGLSKWKFIKKIVSVSQITSPTTSTSTTRADTLTESNNQTAATNGVFKIIKAVSVTYKLW